MTLNQILYFRTVAKYENYHKAAEMLFVSQPSISRAITSMEKEMGVVLFEKNGRGVVLTRAGKIFLEYADRIAKDCAIATRKMEELSTDGGKVEIGYVFPLAGKFIPHSVREFLNNEENKKVVFNFWQNHTPAIVDRVLNGQLDVGFGGYIGHEELEYFPLITQEVVIITPRNHPLSEEQELPLKTLESYPIIGYDRESWMGTHTRALYKKYGIEANIVVECPDEYSIGALVAEEFGIALVPRTEYIEEMDVVVHRIQNLTMRHQIFMFWKKERYNIPAVEKFLEYMMDRNEESIDNKNTSIFYLKDIFNY